MANNQMLKGTTEFYDDFSGPFSSATNGQIASKHVYTLGTGTNTVTRLAVNGSAARMLGDTNEAADMGLFGPVAYEVDECGLLTGQWRIRINTSIAHAAVFVGFTDADSDNITVQYENGSVSATATDAFGVIYEGEQSTLWYTVGVGSDTSFDTARVSTNIDALVIATWVTIRIEADNNNDSTTGVVRYRVWIDGKLLKTAATDATGWTTSHARSSITYCPVVNRLGRATAYSVDVCEASAGGGKGTTLD